MDSINVTTARKNLYKLIQNANQHHAPIQITGKNGNAVLLSEEDWKAIEETLYLNAVPGMVQSILDASKEPLKESVSADEVEW